jgi:hypothetical protein
MTGLLGEVLQGDWSQPFVGSKDDYEDASPV